MLTMRRAFACLVVLVLNTVNPYRTASAVFQKATVSLDHSLVKGAIVFLPRNYNNTMNADPVVVERCAAKAVKHNKDVFGFANNQWNDESCVLPEKPYLYTNETKTFFEKLPSMYEKCPCREDVDQVRVLRNTVYSSKLMLYNITSSENPVGKTLFDRLPRNIMIRFFIFPSSELVFYETPSSEQCVEGTESLRINSTMIRVLVNETLHTIRKNVTELRFAKAYKGSGFSIIDMTSLVINVNLPSLHHVILHGGGARYETRSSGALDIKNPSTFLPKNMGEKIDERHYEKLFQLTQFSGPNKTTNKTDIVECDYVCGLYTEWASIRSSAELQMSLDYVNNNNATMGKHKEIAIGLVRNENYSVQNKLNSYAWIDESPLDYTNWKDGAPSNSLRKNVVMNLTDGTWTDVDDDYKVTACLCRNAIL